MAKFTGRGKEADVSLAWNRPSHYHLGTGLTQLEQKTWEGKKEESVKVELCAKLLRSVTDSHQLGS